MLLPIVKTPGDRSCQAQKKENTISNNKNVRQKQSYYQIRSNDKFQVDNYDLRSFQFNKEWWLDNFNVWYAPIVHCWITGHWMGQVGDWSILLINLWWLSAMVIGLKKFDSEGFLNIKSIPSSFEERVTKRKEENEKSCTFNHRRVRKVGRGGTLKRFNT